MPAVLKDDQSENAEPKLDGIPIRDGNLQPGTLIGDKYEIVEKLGAGGMGAVYKARHQLLGRTVALKILHSNLSNSPEYLERFRREALVASKLEHPHAITLFDFGIQGAAPFLVMQFVQGRTLKEVIQKEGALSLDRVGRIISQIGSAIAEAHRLGIVHRDLKPDNIMLSQRDDGTEWAWVLDFGIAKPVSGFGSDVSLTMAGVLMGTPLYMSPEQGLNKDCDQRSDVYSIGVILYEMIAGAVPFDSTSPVQLMFKHIHEKPVPVRKLKPELGIPAAISEVVSRALEKEPEKRFQSVGELVVAFQSALISNTTGTGSIAAVKSSFSLNTVLIGAGSALLLLLGIAFSLHSSTNDTPLENSEPAQKNIASANIPAPAAPALEPAAPTMAAEQVQKPLEDPIDNIVETNPLDLAPPAQVAVVAPDTAPQTTTELLPSTSDGAIAPSAPVVESAPAVAPPTEAQAPVAEIPGIATIEQSPPSIATPTTPYDAFSLIAVEQAIASRSVKESKSEADKNYADGQAFFEQRQYLEALDKFKSALIYRPTHLGATLSLGATLLRLNTPDLAYQYFDRALKDHPEYPPTFYNLAAYYGHIGDATRSVDYLKKAIALYPKFRAWLATDSDFDPIRESVEFQAIASAK